MKKVLLFLLTLCMLFSAIPFSVSAADDIWDAFYDSLPAWDDKNNYIDYDNEDGHKTEGYRPGKITVFMTEEFMSTHEAPVPADFVDYDNFIDYEYVIADIIHKDSYDYNEFDIIIEWYQELYSQPIESTISSYIIALEDFECLKIVEKVRANYVSGGKVTFYNEWTDYNNYLYYKNEDNCKREGYITNVILVRVNDKFESFILDNYSKSEDGYYYFDASLFPEIQDKIKSVKLGTLGNMVHIRLENREEEITDYTEEHLDEYVEILKYVCENPFVVSVTPNSKMVGYTGDPIDPPVSETDDTTTDAEEVTEPVTTEQEETTAQKNHQTGDELYFLMASAVLAFAVVTFITTIKKRAKNR